LILIENDEYNLSNIIARFNPDAEKQILLGAHWDTRPWADQEPKRDDQLKPIIGANDGASGVAVLLALADIFHHNELTIGVTLLFLDGEDLGMSGESESYAQGSLFFLKIYQFQNRITRLFWIWLETHIYIFQLKEPLINRHQN